MVIFLVIFGEGLGVVVLWCGVVVWCGDVVVGRVELANNLTFGVSMWSSLRLLTHTHPQIHKVAISPRPSQSCTVKAR